VLRRMILSRRCRGSRRAAGQEVTCSMAGRCTCCR
jgi:hypothetical protein